MADIFFQSTFVFLDSFLFDVLERFLPLGFPAICSAVAGFSTGAFSAICPLVLIDSRTVSIICSKLIVGISVVCFSTGAFSAICSVVLIDCPTVLIICSKLIVGISGYGLSL